MKRLFALIALLGASPLLALDFMKVLKNADALTRGADKASKDFDTIRQNSPMITVTIKGGGKVPIPKATFLLKCAVAGGGQKGGQCSSYCNGAADCAKQAIEQIQMVLNALIDNALSPDSFLMTVLETLGLDTKKLSTPGKQIIEMAKTLDAVKSAIQN